VLADQAADVFAVGARLGPETGRVGGQPLGQGRSVQDLVAVEVRQRDLGRRDEIPRIVLQLEEVRGEFRKVAGPRQARFVGDERREDLSEAPFPGVDVEHEIDQGPFHPGGRGQGDREARPGDLGRPVEIEDPKARSEIPVGQRLEIELPGLAGPPDLDVARGVRPDGHGLVGQVGDIEEGRPDPLLQRLQPVLEGFDPLSDELGLGDQGGRVPAGPLEAGDFLGGLVPAGPQILDLAQGLLPGLGQAEEFREVDPDAALGALVHDQTGVFENEFRIQHGGIIPISDKE